MEVFSTEYVQLARLSDFDLPAQQDTLVLNNHGCKHVSKYLSRIQQVTHESHQDLKRQIAACIVAPSGIHAFLAARLKPELRLLSRH